MPRVNISRLALEVGRHERKGDFRKALEGQLRIVEASPASAKAYNKLGDVYERLGDHDQAGRAWQRSAELHRRDGFLLKAIAVLRKVTRRNPGDLELRVDLADLHAQLGHATEAAREYEAAAEAKARDGDWGAAALLLTKLVEVLDDPRARARLARLHARLGRTADAVAQAVLAAEAARGEEQRQAVAAALDDCLALDLGAEARSALAAACSRLDRHADAVRLLEGVAQASPDDQLLRRRLADGYLSSGRAEQARALYEALARSDPEDDASLAGLARALVACGRAREAWRLLDARADRLVAQRRAARLVPLVSELVAEGQDATGLNLLARVQAASGDPGSAQTYARLADLHARQGEAALERAARELAVAGTRAARTPAARAPAARERAAARQTRDAVAAAAALIRGASALVFATGSELSVEFGLPDLADPDAFWRAFPAYREQRLRFEDVSDASLFLERPRLAWGYFGSRLLAARARQPHAGVALLARLRGRAPGGGFAVTSSVEGLLLRAGFDSRRLVECRGSLHWLQCTKECGAPLTSAEELSIEVDPVTLLARDPLPRCPACGAGARPNVLLLSDWSWDMSRVTAQDDRLQAWLARARKRELSLVVLEVGESPRLPLLRPYVRRAIRGLDARVVRISDDDCAVPEGGVGVPLGPREGLAAVEQAL
jgi:NAD-dependent SIR2 family protein deacetylase/Flp pilus assembly protein TadD